MSTIERDTILTKIRLRIRTLHNEASNQCALIWLDSDALDDSIYSLRTKLLLRENSDIPCYFYNNLELCSTKIQKLKQDEVRLLVIVSDLFVEEILPIAKRCSILIFCSNCHQYQHLKKDHSNIIEICSEHETLKNSIQRELPLLKFNLFGNQKVFSTRSLPSAANLIHNKAYFSYMLFVNFLKRIPSTDQAKDIMLDRCQHHFRLDNHTLEEIDLFRKTYTPEQAIAWYKKESFVFSSINRAFRTENVTLWYIFRFYISDLSKQIENAHKNQNWQGILQLYRGDAFISTEEIESLKSNINGFISTNAFFSTSKQIDVALMFAGGIEEKLSKQRVLFEITVDTSNLKNTTFVDINEFLGNDEEQIPFIYEDEILFNVGSVFQIKNVYFNDEYNMWRVEIEATDERIDSIIERIKHMEEKFHNTNDNLLFGHLLIDMNQYVKANSYFQMILKLLPKSHYDVPLVYDYIGDLNMYITNWNEALKSYELSYKIKRKNSHSYRQTVGITLNSLGNLYKSIGDHCQALKHYFKVLDYQINPVNKAITLLNIGAIYIIKKNYTKALDRCLEARDLIHEHSLIAPGGLVRCYRIIGDIYFAQDDFDQAKDFYFAAFDLSKNSLFDSDLQRIVCVKSLVDLYAKQNMKQQAIDFCSRELNFYEHCLTKDHPNIAHLLMILAELYEVNEDQRIDYLQKALNILEENRHHNYDQTANCFKLIGKFYAEKHLYEQAKIFFKKTLEIQKQIYPNKHLIIKETQYLIDMINV
ncbi:unnamed protein product [Adineta ricciae]|uniref:Uncharacterized protein n=2 Tax=Adineta ricciae TaxID=249248 RepID=A0A815CY90_ADIRI|nr:unnamed protein product [Adineta ricciae]